MDHFAECLVKKQPDSSDRTKKVIIWIVLILVCLVTIYFSLTITIFILFITAAAIYAGWYLLTSLNVEYEYAVTNDQMDVDKIIAKRKRVHMITVDVGAFEAFGELTDEIEDRPNSTLILCSDNTGVGEYYADLQTEEYGDTRIVFTPNDKVVDTIVEALPPTLRIQWRERLNSIEEREKEEREAEQRAIEEREREEREKEEEKQNHIKETGEETTREATETDAERETDEGEEGEKREDEDNEA